jgi:hypothetical protein
MKPIRYIALSLMVVPVGLFALGGCSSGPAAELTLARQACIEMMQQVPVYYEDFEFWDAGSLREDPDLRDMYEIWYERKIEHLEERYGVAGTDIDYFGEGEGLLDIMKVDYDIQALRDRINTDFYRDTDYEDAEVWRSPPAHVPQSVTGGWVLAEGMLVRGGNNSNVDDYLSVSSGKELSMYDKNAAALLEKLPEGTMARITRSPYPRGLIVSGMSFRKETKEIVKWTNVYKFESAEAAGSVEVDEYFQGIENDFGKAAEEFARRGEDSPFRDFCIEREGEFVEWSLLIEVKYMVALLFYG